MKTLKNWTQKLLIISPNLFFAHRPELTFDIINMSQDTSVSLSVVILPAGIEFQGWALVSSLGHLPTFILLKNM